MPRHRDRRLERMTQPRAARLLEAGVRRVVVVNWHEGNSPTLRLAAGQVQRRLGPRAVIAEAHVITNALFPDEMEFTHAGWPAGRSRPNR